MLLARGAPCRCARCWSAKSASRPWRRCWPRCPPTSPVYAAGQAVMDAIVGFHIHRGILALGRRRADAGAAALLAGLPRAALVVALFGIANHDNMGGLFRNAAAFGADAVLLDAACCDPLYRKAIRVSVGAALTASLRPLAAGEDAWRRCWRRRASRPLALSPARRRRRWPNSRRRPAPAVLLGAEGPGLPAAVLARPATVRDPHGRAASIP